MSLSVNKVNFSNPSSLDSVDGCNNSKVINNTHLLEQNAPMDMVQFKGSDIPEDEQKEIIRSARTDAAGWSILGDVFSTLYYGLRSNKTVAKKYDLDPEKDKNLIKEIKTQQTLWTLPGAVFPFFGGVFAWLYNKNMNPEKIDL